MQQSIWRNHYHADLLPSYSFGEDLREVFLESSNKTKSKNLPDFLCSRITRHDCTFEYWILHKFIIPYFDGLTYFRMKRSHLDFIIHSYVK